MKSNIDNYPKELQIKLTVSGRSWIRVQSFKDSGPDDRHYVVEVNPQGDASVRFGDGKRGRLPAVGARISATYRFGVGAAENLRKRRNVICFSLS